MENEFINFESLPFKPIPKDLYSAYLNGPFTHCLDCEKELLSSNSLYQIEKVYKGTEPIFEYALCNECAKTLLQKFSQESLAAMQNYFWSHCKNPFTFFLENFQKNHCSLCDLQGDFYEYTISGILCGSNMISCFCVCEKCNTNMGNLMSQKTKETLKDFIETKFPGIPKDLNLLPVFSM
jgi:hypothetical protein